ncbi:choice-of-anchor A family protein [Rhizorhabdus sp. FW153]|uniref:choice-of-anchor A family protein n=1 Tax=Rhizorhabdus sp. FW153 TaxID=3400216 RepID=UPI003CE84F5D
MRFASLLASVRNLFAVWLLAMGQIAGASMIAEADFLYEWNLVVFDNLDSRKEIEGKTFVGGEARYRYETKGDAKDYSEEIAKQREELLRATSGLSENLQSLASTDKVSIEKNSLILRSDAKLGVFDLSLDDLQSLDGIRIEIADGTSMIVNVSGKAGGIDADFDASGIGKNSQLIWNFYEAQELEFEQSFFGTILSPFASVRNDGSIAGTLVAESLDQRGALKMGSYTPAGEAIVGDAGGGGLESVSVAPEPSSWLLLMAGFAAIGAVLRRRPPTFHPASA